MAFAIALAVALSVVAAPLRASAAGESFVAPKRPLLLNGQTLSKRLYPAGWDASPASKPSVGQRAQVGNPSQQSTVAKKARRGPLFWSAVGAGIGGAAGLVMIAGADCDKPENLCPVAPIMGAMTGAIFGLLFGLGR
jgi:hypothetical protein